MVEFWKPLVPSSLAEQEQASSECFLERNRVALREIFAWCVPFRRKKYSHLGVAPEPLTFWYKELEGLLLRVPEHIPGFFIKKSSDIARSRFFFS